MALSKDGLLPAAGERGPCIASVRPVTAAPRLVCPCSGCGAGAGAPMGKGGGTRWPRPAVCLASVPRAQRPRRAAQNPLHEAPIPACAWTGSTLDLATSGLPARSPRPLTGRPGCCTSPGHPHMLPPPAAIPFTPSEGPGPPRTALSRGKAAPSARPPPLRPAAAVQPAVTFSVVRGLTPSACRPWGWGGGVPSASRWDLSKVTGLSRLEMSSFFLLSSRRRLYNGGRCEATFPAPRTDLITPGVSRASLSEATFPHRLSQPQGIL